MPLGNSPRSPEEEAAWRLLSPAVARIAGRIEFLERSSAVATPEHRLQYFSESVKLERLLSYLLSFILPRQYPGFDKIAAHIHKEFADFPETTRKRLIAEESKGWRGRPVVRRYSVAVALAWREDSAIPVGPARLSRAAS